MSEWEKVCKEMDRILYHYAIPETWDWYQIWIKAKVVGDAMDRAIKTGYCGECDVHKQTISELQEANKQLRLENDMSFDAYEVMGKLYSEKNQKLKTLYRMLEEWEKTTSHPDATLINIRNLKKVFPQNTEENRA